MNSLATLYGTGPGGRISQAGSAATCREPQLGPEVPRLQVLLDAAEELGGRGPVDDAMVPRHREVDHVPDSDGVVHHHGALFDGVEREDGALRWVDDGNADDRTERPRVGDGERSALHVVRHELLGAGPG